MKTIYCTEECDIKRLASCHGALDGCLKIGILKKNRNKNLLKSFLLTGKLAAAFELTVALRCRLAVQT